MELKFDTHHYYQKQNPCSNRTFMELKSDGTGNGHCKSSDVLIAPLWN